MDEKNQKEIIVNNNKLEVLRSALQMLQDDKRLRLIRYNRAVGLMKIRTKPKASIIGKILTVQFEEIGQKTKIKISSKKRKSIFTKKLYKSKLDKSIKVLSEEIQRHLKPNN